MSSSEAYGHFAWVYDGPLGQPFAEATAPSIERIVRGTLGSMVGPALDLACGTGMSCKLLREMGFEPIGVDASMSMLGQARGRAASLVCGDLRRLPVAGRFRLVTCLYDSLNHMLEPGDLAAAAREVASVLAPGGLFVFDVNQPEVYEAVWDSDEPFTFEDDQRSMLMRTSFDRESRIATAVIEGSVGRGRRRFRFVETRRQRAWTFEELGEALDAAGLRVDVRLDYDPFEQSAGSGIGIKWLIAALRR